MIILKVSSSFGILPSEAYMFLKATYCIYNICLPIVQVTLG